MFVARQSPTLNLIFKFLKRGSESPGRDVMEVGIVTVFLLFVEFGLKIGFAWI